MSAAVSDVLVSLKIDGDAVSDADLAAIVDIQAEEGVDLGDALILAAEIRPRADGEWASPIDRLAMPGVKVSMELRSGSFVYRFEGTSAQAEWKKEGTAPPRLTVKAIDKSAELDAEERAKAWSGQTDSAIASSIFSTYHVQAKVDATTKALEPEVHVVLQRGSDWSFLLARAERCGFSVFFETEATGPVGHFRKLDPTASPQGELALGYTAATISLDAKVDLLGGHRVTAARFPALRRRPEKADAAGTEGRQGKTSLGGRGTLLLDALDIDGELSPAEAAKVVANKAASRLELSAEYLVGADVVPVRSRRPVLVKGLGATLSGQYDVTRVRHRVQHDRFTQLVTLHRNAVGLRGDEPFGRTGGLSLGGVGL